ncbi:succinate--CoA ligase [GDP-forming] subunit beta, mitochondrial-like isoform X1 [Argiope bruennichi]|uniref:Succinate--CoA ligase [GDP-forming] subunit beta, mitochondrial n=2 Tax=Argiope bruennichi TaxID=94029 RepID=A0A8T0E3D3_ARGBR|nr:succinate--CoA ligase [GDP-forming] subunit beta, mitochondrial-like isoform X1 [Argiope bruennichi]KAF8766389.1 Succinate--CoA ligase [GDP-forming] subunit like protein [Argiope bruennichi]
MAFFRRLAKHGSSLYNLLDHKLPSSVVPVRYLNLQEYQSKQLMQENGINVQNFRIASSVNEAEEISHSFHVDEYVIKAQILAGGRGKGVFSSGLKGGVKLTRDPKDVPALAKQMLGYNLVTKQTPKNGVTVNKIMIAEAVDISRETYLAILMDRESGGPVIVASPAGGVDIEEVAKETPELIYKEVIDITRGITDSQARNIAQKLKFEGDLLHQAAQQIKKLYDLFIKVDATQIEINPFGETKDSRVLCFDAKFNFDDNAEFRQKKIFEMDDHSESDPREVDAAKYHLNYIGMDGNIACMVNGAGLAMATMDIIHIYGGSPANFLDVGGMVQEDQVYQAFRILTSDEKVKAVLVNIFGGIVNCAIIAKGITNACRNIQLKVPLIVRLEGTNVDEAKAILANSGLPIVTANDLDDAAKKAVVSLQ